MIERWLQRVMNHELSLQERMFRLITGVGIVALVVMLICGILTGENTANLLTLVGCIAFSLVVVLVSIRKNRINTGATLIAVVLLIFFVSNFFTSGGMYGGAPLWLAFFAMYISLILHGRRRFVFFVLSMAATVICYCVAYNYPQYVVQHSLILAYQDSVVSVILVGALTSVMILFQGHLYKEENRISIEQKKEIEELNEAENRFFSSMSHEIRTPINTIIGLNEMILRGDISEDIAENARNIQGASKMLLTLINDILDLSKMESGKMEVVNVPYATGELFSDIINMIWIKAKEKNLEFHLDIDSSIPSMLCGDEVRIKQILINLLNNAVKYTKEGSVTLSVRSELLSLNRVRVYYSVEDTGQGVKKEDIPFLFNAFKRVDESKNRHIEGTGLGLSIVKQLVNLMGGEISVNSVYTKGSTFLVVLEQDVVNSEALGTFTLESRVRTADRGHYKQSFEAPKARLLIVDDNEMNLKVATKLLSQTKMQIDTAKSGEECLQLTQNQHYDGILMDHMMPGMDGIACLHALRVQSGGMCQDVPVIALTANAGSENQLLYKKEGFSGYLAKPVNGTLLEAAILNILPRELVLVNADDSQTELGKDVLMFDTRQQVPLMITTDSVCDLPKELVEQLGIAVCPYYVCTDYGRFMDEIELKSDDLLTHIAKGKKGASMSPAVEEYESFFAQKLTEAQNIIHITMAKNASSGYRNACEAAKSFENVTVIESGHLSSGMGIEVLYAAQMVRENADKAEIIKMLEKLKGCISTSFVLDNTMTLSRSGRIPKKVQTFCDALLLHPVIVLRKSKMTVGRIHIGDYATITKNYVRKTLKNARSIDRRILFLTYAGLDEQNLSYIQKLIAQYCPFERVYLQKASSAISSNCGPGAFGLLFMRKHE